MDMMNELLRLRDGGKLSGSTAYWFRPAKTNEELYDCVTDPFNLHNLIDDPQYAGKIKELRNALDEFINKIHDKSSIPEAQMIEQMWPGGVQPKTAQPVISMKDETIRISCTTAGASIGYILSEKELNPGLNNGWQLYQNPVKTNGAKYLYVIANRIGYADSEVVTKKLLAK